MEGLVCREVCFQVFQSLGIDSYVQHQLRERNKIKNIVSLINIDLFLQFPQWKFGVLINGDTVKK
jgi:hypothetical protein